MQNLRFGEDLATWKYPYTRLKASMYGVLAVPGIWLCLSWKIRPNVVTFLFMASGIFALALSATGHVVSIFAAAIIFFLSPVLDVVDGYVARATGAANDLGSELDSFATEVRNVSFYGFVAFSSFFSSGQDFTLLLGTFVAVLSLAQFGTKRLRLEFEKRATEGCPDNGNQRSPRFSARTSLQLTKALRSLVSFDGRARYLDFVLVFILIDAILLTTFGAVFLVVWNLSVGARFLRDMWHVARF